MIAAARWLVVALALAGVVIDVLCLAGYTRVARIGISTDRAVGMHGYAMVQDVAPGSPADLAGIHRGDMVSLAQPADEAMLGKHVRDTVVHLRMASGHVMGVPLAVSPLGLRDVLLLALGIVMALLAVLLCMRAWIDRQARWLALGFLWLAFVVATIDVQPRMALALNLASDVTIAIGMLALVFFATGWTAMPPRVARGVRRIAVPVAAVYLAAGILGDWSIVPAGTDLVLVTAAWVVLIALVIASLAVSAQCARGGERRRIGWILLTMTVAFAPWMAYETLLALHVVHTPWMWLAFTTFALPAGFAYAMLRHRVIDLGFALNRAAVFAATTALLVGLFGALQWGANQVLVQATHMQGFAVQMAIAVIVLYAVRFLRLQADAFVARVFFAKRQRRIEAIRTLARSIDAVESPIALGEFIVEQLRNDTGIESALYVETDDAYVRVAGSGGPAMVARDDAAAIALRAYGAPARIPARDDRAAATAFPLAVRGRLRGALVCVLPAGDDEFAPDEQAALALLADRACVVREDLLTQELRRELDDLRLSVVRRATSPLAAE